MTTATLPPASAVQSVLGNSGNTTVQITSTDLALNLLGSGLIPTDRIYPRTWADLVSLGAFPARKGAEVADSDKGTHQDPVTLTTVPNAGIFSYVVGKGWTRVGSGSFESAMKGIEQLQGVQTKIIGRKDTPVVGGATSDQHYIWVATLPKGQLTELQFYALATGSIEIATWKRSGTTMTRTSLKALNITATGLLTLDGSDFGMIETVQGEYISLRGPGILGANSTAADDGGWWQVSPYVNPSDSGTLWTGFRLEARWTATGTVQIVTTEKIEEIETRLEGVEGGVPEIDGGTLLAPTGWAEAGSQAHKAPIIGGRTNQHLSRASRNQPLAHFAVVADVVGPPAGLANVADPKALFGATTLRLTTSPGVEAVLAPTTPSAVPIDVRNGSIAWNFRPMAGMFGNLDRLGFEIHSAGTPAAPTGNYHTTDVVGGPYHIAGQLTGRTSPGRWQSWSIASSQLTAVGAGADLSAIKFARLILRSTTSPAVVDLGNIVFRPNWFSKAKAILYFDDGYLSQLTEGARRMARYGFPGVLFPSPLFNIGVMPNLMNSAQLIALHEQLGWQMGSQGVTTEDAAYFDALDEDGQTAEFGRMRGLQSALGLTGGEHGSYFSAVSVEDMAAYGAFRKHFRSVRSFGGGFDTNPPYPYGETLPYGDHMAIRALDAETPAWGANNGSRLIAHVDQAIAAKGLAAMVWHDGLAAAGNIRSGFDALLAYLDAHRDQIDVVTESDIHRAVTAL